MKLHPMWEEYPYLQKNLISVIELIEDKIVIENTEIRDKLVSLISSGGKLLRPAYSLLFSSFRERETSERSIAVAAAIEVLHLATLVHDDVIDKSELRRQQTTFNADYNNRVAVYTGDYLFTVLISLLAEYVEDTEAVFDNRNVLEAVLLGELDQMEMRYNPDMTLKSYIKQIEGKTASLFGFAAFSGIYEKDKKKENRLAYQIGKDIGMSFQIVDDLLDYSDNQKALGKPVMQDFKEGVYTAPIIYAMQENKKEFLPYLEKREKVKVDELEKIRQLIIENRGIEKAETLSEKYTTRAKRNIAKLPHTKERDIIEEISNKLLTRKR